MSDVCLVHPCGRLEATLEELCQALQAAGLVLDRLDEQTDPRALPGSPAPGLILLGPALARPLATARALHQHWPASEMLFLQPLAKVAELRASLGLAPMLGLHWSIEGLDDPGLMPRLVQIATAARRRLQFRATLGRVSAQLRQSKELAPGRHNLADHYLASFIEFSQDALIGVDLQLDILFWSRGAAELTGVAAKLAVGQPLSSQAFWSQPLASTLQRLAENGQSLLAETSATVAGAAVELEVLCSPVRDQTGSVLGFSLLLRDVTALRQQRAASEAVLQAEYRHLSQLFQQAPGFVVVTRAPDHRIELANRAFQQLVGSSQLIGLPAPEVFPELEGQRLEQLLDRVQASGRPFVGRGMRVRTAPRSGGPRRVRYLDFVFQPVLSEDGGPGTIFCQGHDVTAQVQLREQLKRSEEHLEALVEERTRELQRSQMALYQAQKLEAVGKLTGGVAHDFNNVLQIIGANLQLLRSGVGDEPRLQRRVDSALQAVDRGARLSGQLLAFARRQPLSPAPTDLNLLLASLDELLRRALGEHIRFEVRAPAGLWTVLVDPVRLENVVLNLVINARDAMPEGGQLSLELTNVRVEDGDAARLGDLEPGHYVLLNFSDNGCGMAAEVAEQVFEPFFTTKPEGKGTGLGLSMAYGFAKQSGGHIRLMSEPGVGTAVLLYLPRTLDPVSTPAADALSEIGGGSETILLVEDDPALQAAVMEQLTGLGYKVLRASDAQSALTILQSGVQVDLLFTDVVMPGPLRSTELARQARLLQPGIGVLFTSGYSQDAIIHDGRLDPGVELLSKPYRHEDLARRLRQMLRRETVDDGSPSPATP